MTILLRASVKEASVRIHGTDFPSPTVSLDSASSGNRLILPWKCRHESWLSDHLVRWSR